MTDLIWQLPLLKFFESDSNMVVTSLRYFHFPRSHYLSANKVVFNKMSFEQSVTVGFMNQSMRPIEPCDCSSQSIFVKKPRDRLGKSVFRMTNTQIATNHRSGRTHFVSSETQEHQSGILILVVTLYGFSLILLLLDNF